MGNLIEKVDAENIKRTKQVVQILPLKALKNYRLQLVKSLKEIEDALSTLPKKRQEVCDAIIEIDQDIASAEKVLEKPKPEPKPIEPIKEG